MRRSNLLTVTLLTLLTAGPARGQGGINLSWNDCGTYGTLSRTFACDTNEGEHAMVASFVTGLAMEHVVGMVGVIDLCSMDAVLPAWWQMGGSTCRPTAVSADFDFTDGPASCADYWRGLATGGMSYQIGYAWEFNAARILAVAAIPEDAVIPIDESTEYYAFRIVIRNDRTIGADACAGCASNVCIVLNAIELYQPAGYGDLNLTNPINRYELVWQGMVVGCPFVVPAKKTTWGQVKAMYR